MAQINPEVSIKFSRSYKYFKDINKDDQFNYNLFINNEKIDMCCWKLNNCSLILKIIHTNNVKLFKKMLTYVTIKNKEDVLKYCCCKGLIDIVDYLLKDKKMNNRKLYYNLAIDNNAYWILKTIL